MRPVFYRIRSADSSEPAASRAKLLAKSVVFSTVGRPSSLDFVPGRSREAFVTGNKGLQDCPRGIWLRSHPSRDARAAAAARGGPVRLRRPRSDQPGARLGRPGARRAGAEAAPRTTRAAEARQTARFQALQGSAPWPRARGGPGSGSAPDASLVENRAARGNRLRGRCLLRRVPRGEPPGVAPCAPRGRGRRTDGDGRERRGNPAGHRSDVHGRGQTTPVQQCLEGDTPSRRKHREARAATAACHHLGGERSRSHGKRRRHRREARLAAALRLGSRRRASGERHTEGGCRGLPHSRNELP